MNEWNNFNLFGKVIMIMVSALTVAITFSATALKEIRKDKDC